MPGVGRASEQQPASPLAGLASLATATSLAMGSSQIDPQQAPPQHQHSGTSRAFAAPLLGSLSSVQQMAILSSPPMAGLQECDITVMCHWMNKVALQLDDVLVDGVHVLAEGMTAAAAPAQGSVRPNAPQGSPSARFQNLLIHARSRGIVQGFYEAMLTRCAPDVHCSKSCCNMLKPTQGRYLRLYSSKQLSSHVYTSAKLCGQQECTV